MSQIVQAIRELFAARGSSQYGGEAVTQLEHALQSAQLAAHMNEGDALVAAALLHDVGHLLHDLPEDTTARGIDDLHENLAANWLRRYFPPEVSEPVRLHVEAKRYLCTVDEEYGRRLSQPSLMSLQLQGGLMDPDEVAAFENQPHFAAAVQLRKCDDAAKIPGLQTPQIDDFLEIVARVVANAD